MISKVLITRTFFSLTAFAMIVVCFLYATYESYPYPVKKVVTGTLRQFSVFSESPRSSLLKHCSSPAQLNTLFSLYKDNSSQAHEDTIPPLPKTLPYTALLKKTYEIQTALWTSQLYQFLKGLNRSISPHVNMMFGDSNHIELVLNWIIAAHVRLDPPLHNILVISIDQPLCDFPGSKKVPVTCITIPPECFLASTKLKSYDRGIKTRLLVLRLMNFWGYDVASYDSDAVILRNPQHFFDSNPEVQVFAGTVATPWDVSEDWGFSICAGALIVRSHPATEKLWENIHNSTKEECEQCLWNHAMKDLGLKWNVTTRIKDLCKVKTGWQSHGPLASIVFPQEIFCRKCCRVENKSHYYILHLNAGHGMISLKRQRLMRLKSWFLKNQWRTSINSTWKMGNAWLISIYGS